MCYAATVFESLAVVMENSNALEPFSPVSLKGVPVSQNAIGYGGYRKRK